MRAGLRGGPFGVQAELPSVQSVFVSRERTGHGSIECAMRILLLALAVSAMGCGLTSYEKAAGQFGSATAAAVTATRSVVGSAHETCRFRAALHLVEARFQAPEFVRGTDAMALSSGVSTADGKGKLTWGEYCQQLTDYDRALIGALSALDAYASTLKSVAVGDGAAIQTGVAGALAADAGDLGNSLGASSLAKAKDLRSRFCGALTARHGPTVATPSIRSRCVWRSSAPSSIP